MIGGLSAISSEEQSSSGSLHSKQRGESWLLGATLTSKWGSLHVDIKPMLWAPAGVGSYHRRINELRVMGTPQDWAGCPYLRILSCLGHLHMIWGRDSSTAGDCPSRDKAAKKIQGAQVTRVTAPVDPVYATEPTREVRVLHHGCLFLQ